jgi:secreted trypsin-like serine protease
MAVPVTAVDPSRSDEHSYVGLALFGANGSVSHTCSGALLSPRIFVTAGSCTDGMDVALVWFDFTEPFDVKGAVGGQPVTHPAFDNFSSYPNTSDLGIVMLEEPIDLPIYATLPAPNLLDGMMAGTAGPPASFTTIGLGLQTVVPFMQDEYLRVVSVPVPLRLAEPPSDGFSVHLSATRPLRGGAAACFGDRGRPLFLASTTIVVGVASAINPANCGAAGSYYRLDTPFAQEFLLGVLQ